MEKSLKKPLRYQKNVTNEKNLMLNFKWKMIFDQTTTNLRVQHTQKQEKFLFTTTCWWWQCDPKIEKKKTLTLSENWKNKETLF